MGNPYFKHAPDEKEPEYGLIRSLANEVAEIYGIDFWFLPKRVVNPDHIGMIQTSRDFRLAQESLAQVAMNERFGSRDF